MDGVEQFWALVVQIEECCRQGLLCFVSCSRFNFYMLLPCLCVLKKLAQEKGYTDIVKVLLKYSTLHEAADVSRATTKSRRASSWPQGRMPI